MTTSAMVLSGLTDEEVVGRILAGEKELYEVIMRRYNERLYRICRTYVDDADEAEDVVQQSYISAYEHLAAFEGRSRFSTWLTRILINEAMARRSRKSRSVVLEADHPALQGVSDDNPEEGLMNDELRVVLEKTIEGLPEKYRAVFVMRELEEMSVEETGESLGITATNVKVRLNRAKGMLKRRIGGIYREAGVFSFDRVRCDRIVGNVLTRVQAYRAIN